MRPSGTLPPRSYGHAVAAQQALMLALVLGLFYLVANPETFDHRDASGVVVPSVLHEPLARVRGTIAWIFVSLLSGSRLVVAAKLFVTLSCLLVAAGLVHVGLEHKQASEEAQKERENAERMRRAREEAQRKLQAQAVAAEQQQREEEQQLAAAQEELQAEEARAARPDVGKDQAAAEARHRSQAKLQQTLAEMAPVPLRAADASRAAASASGRDHVSAQQRWVEQAQGHVDSAAAAAAAGQQQALLASVRPSTAAAAAPSPPPLAAAAAAAAKRASSLAVAEPAATRPSATAAAPTAVASPPPLLAAAVAAAASRAAWLPATEQTAPPTPPGHSPKPSTSGLAEAAGPAPRMRQSPSGSSLSRGTSGGMIPLAVAQEAEARQQQWLQQLQEEVMSAPERAERARRAAMDAERALREEQDVEYQRSLEEDLKRRQKVEEALRAADEKAQEQQRQQAEAQARQAALLQARQATREALAPEPPEGAADVVLVRVRLPKGATKQRRFAADGTSVADVARWVSVLDEMPLGEAEDAGWKLVTSFPRVVLEPAAGLRDVAAEHSAVALFVEGA